MKLNTIPLRLVLTAGALLLVSGCAGARPAPAVPVPVAPAPEPDEVGAAPEPVEEVLPPARDILGTAEYDLPVEANNWVEAELDFLVGQRSEVIQRWLERGDFYEPWIKGVLRSEGVPTDLYHLAMIESGFVPTARSHAGAVGMWQFMPATGRSMGLRVDSIVDERMDPVRATRAAARHLRSLHRIFNDWALAAAAYNAGSGRINRGLQGFGVTNFWDLAQQGDLAEETRRYVPRLYAVTVIGRDRGRFGFAPPRAQEGFAYDSIHVEYATPLRELARIGGVAVDDLARLNPHLVRASTPGGGYWVWVPSGTGVELQRAWLASDFRKEQGVGTYTVRWGDNLGMLAQLSGVKAARIRELNPSIDFDRLQTGAKLKLPYAAAQSLTERPVREASAPVAPVAKSEPAAKSPTPAAAAADGAAYTVAEGETLWGIARDHGVSVEEIQRTNGLSGSTIRPGQTLRIPGAALAPQPVEHVVQSGESLWGIARKYGSSVQALRTANSLGERPIQPGQRLVVPVGEDR